MYIYIYRWLKMAAKSKIINEDLTKNKLKKFNLYSYYYVRSPL